MWEIAEVVKCKIVTSLYVILRLIEKQFEFVHQ